MIVSCCRDLAHIRAPQRIFTCSFSTDSGDIITIQHGRPSEDKNHLYFKLWGHFCASTNTFIPCEETKQLGGIKIGGKCHLHIQDVATQGDIHHFLHPIGSDEGIRSVKSVRHLQSCNLSVGNRLDRKYGAHKPTLIPKCNHKLGEVVDKMNNHVVFPLIDDDLDDQRDDQLPNGEDNRDALPTYGREQRRKMIGPSTYRNGAILPDEMTKRDYVIGIPQNCDILDIAANHNFLCRDLMNHKKTLVYKEHEYTDPKSRRVEKVDIVCGPVLVSLKDGTKRRVRSGEHITPEQLALISGIQSSNACKGVLDVKRMHVLDLKRIPKNTASVGKNLLSALRGRRLSPMVVRGVGGAMDIAGSTPIPLSSKNAQRDACSHIASHSQNLDHSFTKGMFDAMRRQQPINCFLFNMFIGIYCVKRVIATEGESDETIDEEMNEMKNVLNELKDFGSIPVGATIPTSWTEEDRMQLASMSCPGIRVELVPIEPLFPSEYPLSKPSQDCLWGIVELRKEHFIRPTLFVEKPVIGNLWGNSCNTRKLFEEMRKRGQIFAHLTPKGRAIVEGEIYDDNESDENGNDDESGSADEIQSIPFSSPSQVISLVWNVLVQTSFWSFQKAFDASMIHNDTNSIIPPRSFLMETFGEECYSETLEALNLKPMLSRPLHPPLLSILDPVVNLIKEATNTNPETRRNRGDGITFIERCDEAWGIILKCTICAILNSSALLEITKGVCTNIPNPIRMEVDHFIQKIKEYKWSSRIVHPTFRITFTDMDRLVSFVRKFSEKGKGIFREVVRVRSQSRAEKLANLGRQIRSEIDVDFNPFQLQAIARSIEIPIDRPFGEVQHVSCGYGSKEATKLFTTVCKEDNKGSERQSTDAAIHQQVLPWLLYKIVKFVGDKIEKGDPFIQDELTLMRLTWTNDTLSHLDTGKKVDESDIEHLLCCIYVLIQHTFPSRNMAKVNYIDGEKYHPVCFGTDGKKAIDLPLMQTFREENDVMRDAYERLIRNEDYPFKRLDSTFEVDLKNNSKN